VLVSARKFPGIDQTKLDALAAPAIVDKAPRHLTSPELLDGIVDRDDGPSAISGATDPSTDAALLTADLGGVRDRIAPRDA
jgi:DNA recombination protein RmuC